MIRRGLAAGVARWFGREPERDFVDWAEFARSGRTPDDARGAASGRTARSRFPGHLLWVITEFATEAPCSPVPYRRRPALTSATNARHLPRRKRRTGPSGPLLSRTADPLEIQP